MVKYNKLGTMGEVFSFEEIQRLPNSQNMKEAIKNGCKTDEEIIEYCEKIAQGKKEQAIKTGKEVLIGRIGLFPCQNPYEDCSLDIVYEMVTPKGEYLYIREHCY